MKDDLKKYQDKRDFNMTKEPIVFLRKSTKKLRFVVQHHLARRDHYDVRLEWNGTLKSWAVPKGPSYNSKDKRLAIRVEDHPYSYRNFEGVIPKGQYGGGTVMIFDEGFYEMLGDFEKGLKDGVIKFILKGSRLQGRWSLVHFKAENWLLIKEPDSCFLFRDISIFTTSIRSGRTMEEIEKGIKMVTSKEQAIVQNILITHPEKAIFSRPKISKLDIALYYQKIAKRMMPYLQNRIVSTVRVPNGIQNERFFKKHLDNDEAGIGKIMLPSNSGHREDYYYIKEVSGLISEVQRNSFEFHTWGSMVHDLNHPDVLVFDLDPDEKLNLSHVRRGVRDLKSILDDLNLVSFLKTSGGKGYHVVVPIRSFKNWTDFREFAKNVALFMEQKWPDRYTSNIRKSQRNHKIFIDWIRNTYGSTSVAPYSIRLRKKPSVSMPIAWRELDHIKPDEITMDEAIKRLKRKDPWENFFLIDQ